MDNDEENPHLIFKGFTLKDQKLIKSYSNRFAPFSCECCFATLYLWQEIYGMSWAVYKDRLLIHTAKVEKTFMPLGKPFQPEELAALSELLEEQGKGVDFIQVDKAYIEKFPEIEKYYSIQESPDNAEYIYSTEALSQLPGRKLHKKRNLISQFEKNYPDHTILPIKGNLKQNALDFAHNLIRSKKRPAKSLLEEWEVIQKAFLRFEAAGLEGIIIFVEDQVAAFSVYSRISDQCFDIHFEKSDIRYKGASQMINRETARQLEKRCEYINREQDMGIKGLRKAKMSYQPAWLLQPQELIFKKAE